MKYIAYYRTSTKEQNLGITAQRSAVSKFLRPTDTLIAEYTEQESGKLDNRIELNKAIAYTKSVKGSVLLIAKLDRLSRNLTFISQLMDSKTKFKCCDMPDANDLTIHIFAAVGHHEREMISSRTKAALAELKKQGVKLGNPENMTDAVRAKGRQAVMANAREANKQAIDFILTHRNGKKKMTFEAIADKLNALGYRTRYDKEFSKATVKVLYDRYSQS